MTLRELFQLIGVLWSDTTVAVTADQFFHVDWFKDGFEKLIEGNILDLTISQIAFILFLVLMFFWGLINDYTKKGEPKKTRMTLIKIKEGTKIIKSRYVAETNELRGMLINTFFKSSNKPTKNPVEGNYRVFSGWGCKEVPFIRDG